MNNGVTITIVLSIQFWDSAQYISFCPLLTTMLLLNLINDIRYVVQLEYFWKFWYDCQYLATNINVYKKNWRIFLSLFQKLHDALQPLDVTTFSVDVNKPSSHEDNKSLSDNNCWRFSFPFLPCLQCLLRLSSMQKWVVLMVSGLAFLAVWYLDVNHGHDILYRQQI